MDTSIESLFGQLKNCLEKPAVENPHKHGAHEVLTMDDEEEAKRQESFEEIEKNLKKLPKLSNSFDEMSKAAKTATVAKNSEVVEDTKKGTGDDWFTLPKPDGEMLAKAQRDLILIKHRRALDPKRHYKKERWQVPERFAVGTIVEDSTEFFSSRLTKKQRQPTMLATLMNDKDTTGYFKRKYNEIQAKKTSGKKAHYKKMKSMRHR